MERRPLAPPAPRALCGQRDGGVLHRWRRSSVFKTVFLNCPTNPPRKKCIGASEDKRVAIFEAMQVRQAGAAGGCSSQEQPG